MVSADAASVEGTSRGYARSVKNLRRGLLVAFIAMLAGLVVRFRARSVPPQSSGGWRELEGPDLR
jgi:hypothetical protein